MHPFRLQESVAQNVKELREALGSLNRPLSQRAFAAEIAKEHPWRHDLNDTTIKRWETAERGAAEPDFESVRIMARMAKVSFEDFALGKTPLKKKPAPAEERRKRA